MVMECLEHVILVLGWGMFVILPFFLLVERIAILCFFPWAFRIGIRVVNETVDLLKPSNAMFVKAHILKTETSKCKFVAPDLLLFRSEIRWFPPWSASIAGLIVGSIQWRDGTARVQARISTGVTICFIGFLAGCAVGGMMAM